MGICRLSAKARTQVAGWNKSERPSAQVDSMRLARLHQYDGPKFCVCDRRIPQNRRAILRYLPKSIKLRNVLAFVLTFSLTRHTFDAMILSLFNKAGMLRTIS